MAEKRASSNLAAALKAGESKKKVPQNEVRRDQAHVGAWMPKEVLQQFKILAAERGVKQKELMSEALNDLFRKYRKPEIA